MSTAHALYRHYDADGVLLYVGITNDPGKRWNQHRGDKAWWEEVKLTRLEHFASRPEVLAAEKRAISDERPRWNIANNAGGRAYWQRVEDAVQSFVEDLPILYPILLEGLTEGCRKAYVAAFEREIQLLVDCEAYERAGKVVTEPGRYNRESLEAERAFQEAGDAVGFAWDQQGSGDGARLVHHATEWEIGITDFYAAYKRAIEEV